MIEYTKEEIRDLWALLDSLGYITGVLFKRIENTEKYTLRNSEEIYSALEHAENKRKDPQAVMRRRKVIYRTRTAQGTYKLVWIGFYKDVRELLFNTPLEELPLHVNTDFLSIFAQWRMRIGK